MSNFSLPGNNFSVHWGTNSRYYELSEPVSKTFESYFDNRRVYGFEKKLN